MRKLLKIENLIVIGYALLVGLVLLIYLNLRIKQSLMMPVFVGLFGILPFVIFFRSAYRISPFVSNIFLAIYALIIFCLFIPYLNYSFCLPIPLLIIFLFIIKRERRIGFENWLQKGKFSFVQSAPEDILQTLGREKNWSCYANSFFLKNDREVPYLIWFGITFTSSTTMVNGAATRTTAQNPHVALSFFPQTVGENFKQTIETSDISKQSFWEKLKPGNNEKHPYQTARMPDETFVAAWSILHIPGILDTKLADIKKLLENSFFVI